MKNKALKINENGLGEEMVYMSRLILEMRILEEETALARLRAEAKNIGPQEIYENLVGLAENMRRQIYHLQQLSDVKIKLVWLRRAYPEYFTEEELGKESNDAQS